jgi:hypothetical protein
MKFNTFGELKAALETLSEEELKQPVRVIDRYSDSGSFELYCIAQDDVGPILTS